METFLIIRILSHLNKHFYVHRQAVIIDGGNDCFIVIFQQKLYYSLFVQEVVAFFEPRRRSKIKTDQ